MLLALDIGNTRLKWAVFDGERIVARDALFLAEVEAFVVRAGFNRNPPSRVVGSHVANQATKARIERQFAELGLKVDWVRSTASVLGVNNLYDIPERLGSDRWAALVAAWNLGFAPCIVASAGTAFTIDQLDERGNFIGGSIVAGYHAMLGGLAGNTAALSVDAGDWVAQPRNTRDALATGAIDALVGALYRSRERLVKRMAEQGIDNPPSIVLTGGSAYRLLPHLPADGIVVENLVLEGVRLLAESRVDNSARVS